MINHRKIVIFLRRLNHVFAFSCLFACLTLSAKEQAKQSSLCFIENRGQIMDQYGNARNDIDFKIATGQGLNVFIGKGGIHYQWNKNTSLCLSKGEGMISKLTDKPGTHFEEPSVPVEMCRMDVELVGANENAVDDVFGIDAVGSGMLYASGSVLIVTCCKSS